MIIVRDGKEIQLTWQEIREAYEIMKFEYLKEDILVRADDKGKQLSENNIDKVAQLASHGIDNNDSFWESYWLTIDYAIEIVNKEARGKCAQTI